MKILAALAALPLAALPAQCNPSPEPAPEAHQSAYGVTLDAQPACSVFTARIWNDNTTARTARIRIDGIEHEVLYAAPDSSDEETIYFPNNSGDYTVSVFWAGGTSNYRIWTNCAP